MAVITTTVTINGAEPVKPPRLYWIVQDKVSMIDRLVREDGAHTEYPEGTMLPWAKAQGLKLKKTVDTDEVREFEVLLSAEDEARTTRPDGLLLSEVNELA